MTHQPFIICLTTVLTLNSPAHAAEESPQPIKVDAASITFLDEVEVPAREAGIISRIAATEGQTATKGELLATVDDTRARLALQRATLELSKAQFRAEHDQKLRLAKKSLDLARTEQQRGLESQERHSRSVSQTELDRLQHTVDMAEIALEQAHKEMEEMAMEVESREHEVVAAEHELARRQVIAPFSGLVAERLRQRGEWVEPGQGVFRIVRMDRLRAGGYLDATKVSDELVGRTVVVRIRTGDKTHAVSGKIAFVSPEVDPNTEQVRVWAAVDNRESRLRPGMQVEMVIQ